MMHTESNGRKALSQFEQFSCLPLQDNSGSDCK